MRSKPGAMALFGFLTGRSSGGRIRSLLQLLQSSVSHLFSLEIRISTKKFVWKNLDNSMRQSKHYWNGIQMTI
jgi:hypothetical protein